MLSATRRPRVGTVHLPAEQPCGIYPPVRSYEPDVLAAGAGQVLVQLDPEAGGASDCAPGGVHEYGRGHVLFLISRVAGR